MKWTRFRKQTPSSLAQTYMVHSYWTWCRLVSTGSARPEHEADLAPPGFDSGFAPAGFHGLHCPQRPGANNNIKNVGKWGCNDIPTIWHDAVLVHPVQAAMDSPLEACSTYLQHYEPYLKDPVGFPRVMVTAAFLSSPPIVSARSILLLLTDPFSNKLRALPHCSVVSQPGWLKSHISSLQPQWARVRLSAVPFVSPSDKYQTTMWAEVIWSSPFLVADLTWLLSFPLIVYFGCVLCALCSVHTAFVNRLSKDLVGATVWAHLWVIDQTGEPHGENLIS